ncbi:MAG: succinylglutamic semialdehyde dehydrogenase [Phycisphaerales bacterium]|jgi:succinylglutamic semialdehyde dehydrogenase|nr:succinylglutamic semialdehyde dehydrogenase [Phycisphaerales bacterium]
MTPPTPHQHVLNRPTTGGGPEFNTTDPATGRVLHRVAASNEEDVNAAVSAARTALETWSDSPVNFRIELLTRYADRIRESKGELAAAISGETGKPRWEAESEVDAMVAKIAISVEAFHERRHSSQREQAGAIAATRYKPLGVMAVFGPFNMPGHLPNGHIVPALLAGNTVVFKPSEFTPAVGSLMGDYLMQAGFPGGTVSVLQGGREVGAMLARHRDVDGILFTGSVAAGLALSHLSVDQPGKILALEMGGNNPLVVWNAKDLDAAAYLTIQSAFITSGQRCSCARRLIVPDDATGRAFVDRLAAVMKRIEVGPHTQRPEPFMGPVISDASAASLLAGQIELFKRGGRTLVEMKSLGERPSLLHPGLIDVTDIADRPDTEIFGPLLQLIRVRDFDAAISEANRTAYGLAAGLFSDDPALWERFYRKVRAGVVYWNRQTTGGSSHLPFGGVGLSGNHRPSGYFAADYCSYPVASMEVPTLAMPTQKTPGIG